MIETALAGRAASSRNSFSGSTRLSHPLSNDDSALYELGLGLLYHVFIINYLPKDYNAFSYKFYDVLCKFLQNKNSAENTALLSFFIAVPVVNG